MIDAGAKSTSRSDLSILHPIPNESVVDRIINRLTNSIMSGELKPGDRIPTETELTEAFGVGRNTVREAIKALVVMGVLNIRRSEGTFVASGFSSRMLEPMAYGLVLSGGSSHAVIELRNLIDTGVLKLAIEKATEDDIVKLKERLGEIRHVVDNAPDSEQMMKADIDFHSQIEAIVCNPMVSRISDVIDRVSQNTRTKTLDAFIREGRLEEFYRLHEAMYELVRTHNEEMIGHVINEHFSHWREQISK